MGPPSPRDAIGIGDVVSHFRILARLGEGGMGIVYEAEDAKLARRVALKFLPDAMADDAEALERFRREARAASALNHPNICTIYEIGEHAERPFIAMELLHGRTLRRAIDGRPMEVGKAVDLAIRICDALEAAHERQIIHRDVKPDNIFVTDQGQAKLLDFGLARRHVDRFADAEAPTHGEAAYRTEAGLTLGTVAYMSPEQARGSAVDARTDLFSLGVVLHEMVTGTPPFGGQTVGEAFEAIFTRPPPAVRAVNPDVPPALEAVIAKALEKDPARRYQSASALRSDLQRAQLEPATVAAGSGAVASKAHRSFWTKTAVWVGLAAVVVAMTALLLVGRSSRDSAPPAPSAGRTAIAVLPFVNLSQAPDQEYFSDGLTEELLNALAKNPKLRVTSRTSAFSFKGKDVDLQTIAARLGVTHVVEGSVRRAGAQLRVTAQLVDVATDSPLWSRTYERQADAVFAVQEDIATSVAAALKMTLEGGRTPALPSTSVEAYNAYLQGRYFLGRLSRENLQKAIDFYREALRLDPAYARAWAGLSAAHSSQAAAGYVPFDEGYGEARREAERALELDPNLAEAHARLGRVRREYDWNWTGAEAAFGRALALEPANLDAMQGAAMLASAFGRFDDAIAFTRKAVELDPLRVGTNYNLGLHLYRAGRWDEASAALVRALELNPQNGLAHRTLGLVHLARAKPQDALTEMQREPELLWRTQGLAVAFFALGNLKEAGVALASLEGTFRDNAPFQIAEVYAFRGDADRAFEWLDRAYDRRDAGLTEMKASRLLSALHGDRRWSALLERMKLPAT